MPGEYTAHESSKGLYTKQSANAGAAKDGYKMHIKKCWVVLPAIALVAAGCQRPGGETGANGSQSLTVMGSDTMVNLGQAWAEGFNEKTGANISVQGGGSGTGIAALINGSTQIAESSREMKAEEIEKAKSKGIDPKEFAVAQDGLSVIVNKNNPVSQLTISQLSAIYTGKVTNWKDVGGPDLKIVVSSREKNSGTHDFFLEHVVREGKSDDPRQFAGFAQFQPSSQAIVSQVMNTQAAIGYVGLGYAEGADVKEIAVATDAGGNYVLPSMETVLDKTYPIARPLYFYVNGEPTGTVKEFIDYALSPEGQQIVEKMEFVPVQK